MNHNYHNPKIIYNIDLQKIYNIDLPKSHNPYTNIIKLLFVADIDDKQ